MSSKEKLRSFSLLQVHDKKKTLFLLSFAKRPREVPFLLSSQTPVSNWNIKIPEKLSLAPLCCKEGFDVNHSWELMGDKYRHYLTVPSMYGPSTWSVCL